MARGSEIIVTSNPRGVIYHCIIGAGLTPKPGTLMQIKASSGITSDLRRTVELYAPGASGGRPKGPICILLENKNLGKTSTDAFAAGDFCEVYVPVEGEVCNMLLKGTSPGNFAYGAALMGENSSGKLIASAGPPASDAFMLDEVVSGATADTLVAVMYTGY